MNPYNYFAYLALLQHNGCKGAAGTGCMVCFWEVVSRPPLEVLREEVYTLCINHAAAMLLLHSTLARLIVTWVFEKVIVENTIRGSDPE